MRPAPEHRRGLAHTLLLLSRSPLATLTMLLLQFGVTGPDCEFGGVGHTNMDHWDPRNVRFRGFIRPRQRSGWGRSILSLLPMRC